MGGALTKTAKRTVLRTCGSLCDGQRQHNQTHVLDTISCNSPNSSASSPPENPMKNIACKKISSETESNQANSSVSPSSNKNICAICLDPLNYSPGTSPGQAIFTAQCSHAFHFACISSNVRHGSVTCPICRAHWTQLPRNLKPRHSLHYNKSDPVLQILDNSIATSRVHRRSFLLSARYDDDDSIDPDISATDQSPRLSFSLVSVSDTPRHHQQQQGTSLNDNDDNTAAYLNVRLSQQPPIDLVLIASPNGPHLRLMKQTMALVVFSLRPVDRLAVVTYSSSAARVFPLRRMTSHGKRTALRVIDRLFYTGHAESIEVLKKGVKILEDRVHKNPQSCIFHLNDNPSSSYYDQFDAEVPFTIHRFNVRYGFGVSNGFVMHEFEDFLARSLGGGVRNVQLRIGEGTRYFGIGELRGGEERNFPVALQRLLDGAEPALCVGYSYVESGDDEGYVTTGEVFVGFEDKGGDDVVRGESVSAAIDGGGSRMSSGECTHWDYHGTLMARRWAKHLHGGYRQ